ncbi:Nucleotidyltransferase domain-containing protein [Gammaproteobacteria bacterium]
MRLSAENTKTIRNIITAVLEQEVEIVLFGSRVDDLARGGDVDLLITLQQLPSNIAFTASLLSAKLTKALDGRSVDVLIRTPETPLKPIHEIALKTGLVL